MEIIKLISLLTVIVNLIYNYSLALQLSNILLINSTNNYYKINYSKLFSKLSCVHFVQLTNVSESDAILVDLHYNKFANISVLLHNTRRSTRNLDRSNCNLYIVFVNSTHILKELLSLHIFKIFSKMLVILKNVTKSEINLVFSDRLRQQLFKTSLDIMWIDYENFIRNNFHIYDLFGYPDHNAILNEDQFIDRMIRNENGGIDIRVSLFECPPYVIYNRKINKTLQLDGSEFRSLKEITKNWKITYTYRDFSKDKWYKSLTDLDQNISDVTMCSIWLSELHYRHFDISEFIDYQCITFLVPKPLLLTQASVIYLPYQTSVWIIFCIVMAVTLVLIKLSAWLKIKINENLLGDHKFNSMSMILLEMTNIMTSHGLVTFPKYIIFKILFISWILLNFLIDIGYVTGYTSLLTIPRYSKSIDTIKDFLDQDIHWGESDERSYKDELLRTENIDFINLANQFIIEETDEHRHKLLASHKFSRMVKIISNKFVTDTEKFGPFITEVQPLKTCLFEYYTTFAFPKSSPFKNIFDRQILRIREAGLFEIWFRDIIYRYADDNMRRIFDRHIESTSGNEALTIAHLTGAFYLWCIGLGIATGAFIGELVWIRIRVFKRFYF